MRLRRRSGRLTLVNAGWTCADTLANLAPRVLGQGGAGPAAIRKAGGVRLLVPRDSDPPYLRWLTRSAYCSLMRSGVRVYEYR
jgi:phosphatidylserine/phosphatidylglycerophosphate/cardiolipin synthase-like enzyme